MTTTVFATPADVARAAADRFAELAAGGQFRVGLAGGSTPAALYRLLAERADLDWPKVHAYFGDDRWVPSDHEQSNEGMARRELLDRVAVGSVHPMYRGASPAEDAAAYDALLDGVTLDLLLVGLGDDGHTLSLFPNHDDWPSATGRVAATRAPANWPDRVTLLPAYARSAREILFLVTGAGKRDALARLIAEDGDIRETPSRSLIGPNVRVFCDRASSGESAG